MEMTFKLGSSDKHTEEIPQVETKEESQMSAFNAAFQSIRLDEGKLGLFETVEEEARRNYVSTKIPDAMENKEYYDKFIDMQSYTIGDTAKALNRNRYEKAVENGLFDLDENGNVIDGANHFFGADLLFDKDTIKGFILAKRNGYDENALRTEYQNIVKGKKELFKKAEDDLTGTLLGGLTGYLASPETATDFASPSKIMGSTIVKGALKAFGTESLYVALGETSREASRKRHALMMDEDRTLWDSVKEIGVNSGFAGAFRGIGSTIVDANIMRQIHSKIPDVTDKQIFSRYAQRENYKLTQNSMKHIHLIEKAQEDLENGKVVDISEHTDIDINTKFDDIKNNYVFKIEDRNAGESGVDYIDRLFKINNISKEDEKVFYNMAESYNFLADAIPKFKKYIDTKNLRTEKDFAYTGNQYHGTSSEIKDLEDTFFTESNIYGDGFYTTSKYNIAESYTKKGNGTTPKVYKIIEKNKINNLDLETTSAKDVLDIFPKNLDIDENMSLVEAMDKLRSESKHLNMPSHEVMGIFDELKKHYENLGFNSWSHKGGFRTAGEGHYVRIYFNAKKDIDIVEATNKSEPINIVEEIKNNPEVKIDVETKQAIDNNIDEALKEETDPYFADDNLIDEFMQDEDFLNDPEVKQLIEEYNLSQGTQEQQIVDTGSAEYGKVIEDAEAQLNDTKFQSQNMYVGDEIINKTDFDLIKAYQKTRKWNRENPTKKRQISEKQKQAYLKHANIADDLQDWEWSPISEGNMLFSKFADNLAMGTIAGVETDEEGNITFDPEKFVAGLGGYTALKQAYKSGVFDNLPEEINRAIKKYTGVSLDTFIEDPQGYFFRGTKTPDAEASRNGIIWYAKDSDLANDYASQEWGFDVGATITQAKLKPDAVMLDLKDMTKKISIPELLQYAIKEAGLKPKDLDNETTNLIKDIINDNKIKEDAMYMHFYNEPRIVEVLKRLDFDGVQGLENPSVPKDRSDFTFGVFDKKMLDYKNTKETK